MEKSTLNHWLKKLLMLFFTIYATTLAVAQPESESPYSDQAFDPKGDVWYESPLAWMGVVVLLAGVFIFLRAKGRRTT